MDKEAQKRLADDFVEVLRTTNRDGIEELIRYLQEETDFLLPRQAQNITGHSRADCLCTA